MSKITVFKQRLARLFDDNLRTSVWGNVFDWVIIGLIVISSLEVFLSTFSGIAERYSQVLHFIDISTTVVFTIEVTLRIWTADLIDPKYKGFLGRIRYCLSFYGLIDCLSTYTFYLGLIFPIPATAIKVLRVARLLRVFRYMKAFRLLGKAIASKKEELSISMAVLCIITVILSCLLYFAEHNAQPEVCENGWRTLVWAFAQYIGDPGKVADFPMVTFWGQFIAAIVGLLGIAIFAVPAGLIGSGFLEVIEARNHQKELDKNILKLHNAFERKQDRFTGYQIMPPFLSIADIQARMRMTENAIFEAVDESRDFRVVNLAATVTVDNNPQDKAGSGAFHRQPYLWLHDRQRLQGDDSVSLKHSRPGHRTLRLLYGQDRRFQLRKPRDRRDEAVQVFLHLFRNEPAAGTAGIHEGHRDSLRKRRLVGHHDAGRKRSQRA